MLTLPSLRVLEPLLPDPARLAAFLDDVQAGRIPDAAPLERDCFPAIETFYARDACTHRGMWAIVDRQWTKHLADWIGERRCLEVMAGAGWLARALHDHGAAIRATDDYSWDARQHGQMERVYPVDQCDALAAVEWYGDADVLIVSWSPYEDDTIIHVCDAWGTTRPIVSIGEEDGCNAPPEWWAHF